MSDTVVEELGDAKSLRPRLSVFLPDQQGVLRTSRYRFRADKTRDTIAASGTTYRVEPAGKAQGPVGIAFARNKPAAVIGLPKQEGDGSAWIRAMSRARTLDGAHLHLTPKELAAPGKWLRKAQSFIAVPIALDGVRPIGALCVDMRRPLRREGKDKVMDLAAELHLVSSLTLAPLVALMRT